MICILTAKPSPARCICSIGVHRMANTQSFPTRRRSFCKALMALLTSKGTSLEVLNFKKMRNRTTILINQTDCYFLGEKNFNLMETN